ncbi:UDP-N-acetylmuramoyl-L-alanine--D-glutamate ligase [Chlamydia sp. 17-3921]|uniref:UDP-N-acetylmuramoyl-L-alanine--D-glutamate ligase n=1 Tax=Chlamydia sp. 17-3921 TaxID=2675798 RepID=UPI0019188E99|nr:UDP-N-acetylmuramoyl-L-alanine--D-glutamate ligase [Chlamydia sp. 17-3921]
MSQRVVILGAGISGKTLAKYFYEQGHHVIIVDRSSEALKYVKHVHVKLLEKENNLPSDVDSVIRSPGVLPSHPWVREAKSRKIPVETDIQIALKSSEFQKYPSLGITGSNGKTTTTTFLTHLLKTLGIPALSMGNNGQPILEQMKLPGIRVVEVSSFQLVDQEEKIPTLSAAAILNFCRNHLDYHGTMEAYFSAKTCIMKSLKKDHSLWVGEGISLGKPYQFYSEEIQEVLDKASALKSIYLHDRDNYCAAYALAKEVCHVPFASFLLAIQTFEKPPHRIEYLGKKHDVRYYNDSKATTIDAVERALIALGKRVIIILGGRNKGGDFSTLSTIIAQTAKYVIAMGECREEIAQALKGNVPLTLATNLKDAVNMVQEIAEAGDSVLLSPGCASFDQFQSFEERGVLFKQLIGEMEA